MNLVPQEKEANIKSIFRKHINESPNRLFLRVTWEEIYRYIEKAAVTSQEKQAILRYFKEKTIGYDGEGNLQRAFAIS